MGVLLFLFFGEVGPGTEVGTEGIEAGTEAGREVDPEASPEDDVEVDVEVDPFAISIVAMSTLTFEPVIIPPLWIMRSCDRIPCDYTLRLYFAIVHLTCDGDAMVMQCC